MASNSSADNPSTGSGQGSSSRGMSAMAQLMAKHGQQTKALIRGESVEGKITKVSKGEILMDVNGKSEALVLERDRNLLNNLLSVIKVGDTVTATILSPESDTGQPIVSLRRFMEERMWKQYEKLQKENTLIEVTVTDVTKGGLVIQTAEGQNGFLPQSHMTPGLQAAPGKKISVYLLELNRGDNRLIVTQKETITDEDFKAMTKDMKAGKNVEVVIVNITAFGLFVTVPLTDGKTMDGLIHISEVSWDKVEDLAALFTVGQTITAQIIGTDSKAKRIDLSIKRLTEDPFAKLIEKYPVESKVKGTVTRVEDGNVYVTIEDPSTGSGFEGVIRKEKVPMNTNYEKGQSINVTISEIDTRRHRILLSPVLLEKPIGYR